MESYTIGETPEDVILSHSPPKYAMELVRDDLVTVLAALYELWASGDKEHSENAISLRTSILETLDIEEV